jgi:hypothetical protein
VRVIVPRVLSSVLAIKEVVVTHPESGAKGRTTMFYDLFSKTDSGRCLAWWVGWLMG